MPRSASTWLYNVLRECISHQFAKDPCEFGWIDDVHFPILSKHSVVKVHNFDTCFVHHADFVFYSYRDVRDSLASLERMFNKKPSITIARNLISQDSLWRGNSKACFSYEQITNEPLNVIKSILSILGFDTLQPIEIQNAMLSIPISIRNSDGPSYDPVNLYHKGHITNTTNSDWRNQLDPKLIVAVNNEFYHWFTQNGYDV